MLRKIVSIAIALALVSITAIVTFIGIFISLMPLEDHFFDEHY